MRKKRTSSAGVEVLGEAALGLGVDEEDIGEGVVHVHGCGEVAFELVLLEGEHVVVLAVSELVLDAADHLAAEGAADGVGGLVEEGLGVDRGVGQAAGAAQDGGQGVAGEVGLALEVGEEVGDGVGLGGGGLGAGGTEGAPDALVGEREGPALDGKRGGGDVGALSEGGAGLVDQVGGAVVDAVAGLVLDPVPEASEVVVEAPALFEGALGALAGVFDAALEADASLGLDLGLEGTGEVVVGLVGDDGEDVDALVVGALAVGLDGEAEAAADLLALFDLALGLVECADLEDVGVVPAFAQGRVREDELERGGRVEEPGLVAHDELVGVGVGGGGAAGVFGVAGARGGEVAGVDLAYGRVVEVAVERMGAEVLVCLFEPEAELAVVGRVVRDAVDEEERQDLDLLVGGPAGEAALFVEVAADGLADLDAHEVVGLAAVGLAGLDDDAVGECEVAVAGVDLGDGVAGVVVAAGEVAEVGAGALDGDGLALGAALGLDVDLERGRDLGLGGADGLEVDVGGVEVAGFEDGVDLDALDQAEVVGVDGGEAVEEVVGVAVGGGVAEGAEGVERGDGVAGLFGLHVLRLVEDDDGPGVLEVLDGRAGAGLVADVVDDVGLLLVEGVDVEDQELGRGRLGVAAEVAGAAGGEGPVVEGGAAVELVEVGLEGAEGLEGPFADGDGGDDQDELGPAVGAVELVEGAEEDVGLAGARLHFDGEVVAVERRRQRDGLAVGAEEGGSPLTSLDDAVALLDGLDVGQEAVVGEGEGVAGAGGVAAEEVVAAEADLEGGRGDGLAGERVDDGADGVELVGLAGVELEGHGRGRRRCGGPVTPRAARGGPPGVAGLVVRRVGAA